MENEEDITTVSRRQAMRLSRNLGCNGAHEYEGSWMPCSSHEELKNILDQINSLDEKDDECLPCQQNKEKSLIKRKKKGKKPVRWENLNERGVTGIDTLADGSLVSGPVGAKAESKCPPATSNIGLNIKNRQNAIDTAGYGPLNPTEKNEAFWNKKAKRWSVTITESKKQLCGNCAVFIKTPRMLDCIEAGLGNEEGNAAWDVINAGDLGYCEAFDFKCASARTCDAWVAGGPITEEKGKQEEKAAREIRSTDPDVFMAADSARVRSRQLGCIGIRRYRTTTGGEAWMPCTNESDYRLRMGTSPLARQQSDRREAAFVRRVALAVGKQKPKTKASSLAQTPAPKKDRITGSERNRTGSASDISEAGSITLDDSIEKTLVSKVKIHNAEMQKQGKPNWSKANVRALKAVYRRGAGAFSRSHRPGMTRNQWAMGRVNAFLKILSSGKPSSKAYVTDNDLLPDSHPWKQKQKTLVQRTFLPGTVANLKEKTDLWMVKVLNDISGGRIGADKPKRKKRGRPSLRTIGVDIATRGGALVDEEGLLRCPPTTINPGQFTNWKLEGCNDPSGAAKKIRERISAVDMAKVPENRLVSRQQLAEISKPTMASNFIRQASGAPVADEAVFRRMNPESRIAERKKALSELSKNVQRELEKILGDRNIDEVFASDLDSIAGMTKSNGSSLWTASQLQKIKQTSALLRELDKPEINVGLFGDDVTSGIAVPRNISFSANLSDIFDDNGNLTQDGVSEVFGWMADNVEELATPRDKATSTAIRATYDNQNGTVTFDVVDVFGSDEVSDEAILGIARGRGAEFVTDLSRLSEDDVASAFIPSGADRISSPYVPSDASTDIRVRQPRTTDPTGAMSRFAGQDRVNGKNYSHEQKATMINDLIGGVAGFEFLKPVRIRKSADAPYTEKERLAIDAQLDRAVKHMTENLMFLLGDPDDESMKEFRARAKHWYPAANEYLAVVAQDHGYHPSLVNAAAATISPQMDWNANVALAEHMAAMIKDPEFRVEDDVAKVMAKEFKKLISNQKKLPSLLSTRKKLIKNIGLEIDDLKSRRGRVSEYKKNQINGRIAALEMQRDSVISDFDLITKAIYMSEEELATSFTGKRIEAMTNMETALAHRAHSGLHGMRYINGEDAPLRKINLNPNVLGEINPIIEDEGSGQGYLSNDLKAALMLRYGDVLASNFGENDSKEYRGFLSGFISGNVSSESKVRSFYNNINNPYDEYYKDITNDTWMAVGAFFVPAMAATTVWDDKPVNETDMLFNSLTSLGHGRGYGMVSAAIMNAAEEWKALTGEDFTKHPRAMQSVLWELAKTRWKNASKMQAIGFSRELLRAIANGRSNIALSDRHAYLDFVRLATMENESFKTEGSPLVEFLKSRGLDVSIESMAKMSYQDRLNTYASVLQDRRGRPLLSEAMLVPHKKVEAKEKDAEEIISEMDAALE